MSTKGTESAQKALRWRGLARRKEQGNGRDSIQVSNLQLPPIGDKIRREEIKCVIFVYLSKNSVFLLFCVMSVCSASLVGEGMGPILPAL